eukprot:CAMPEP_0170470938 /NCGR_PEP_ID=MMETSP0123-20130129/13268_1 /TAXON_ID=182087 /ORGANISM="Favella ehrenbergii, Strain Fehren 1" /LENGTH=64 /DNA_ID=CAMNT_0010738307 /DNA_START=198 /DNA_END=392 /DNA_ORIENTATION=-
MYFNNALLIDNEQASLHFNAANAYFLAEDYELAVKHYKMAIDLGYNKPETHYNLGNALCKQDEF